jgi:hypothetical protein
MPETIARLSCEKCQTANSMEPTTRRRFPLAVVALGYVFLIPSLLYCAVSLIAMFSRGATEFLLGGVLLVAGLPALALGAFLVRSRSVWRCTRCAYGFDRL